jgi:uncharacterized protein (TIGR02246 family)
MRSVLLVLIPAFLALVAMGCRPPAPETAPERTAQQMRADAEALVAQWRNLANAGDAAGVAALYSDDAVFVDPFGGVHQGPEAIAVYLRETFAGPVEYQIEVFGVVSGGDLAASYGRWSRTVNDSTGPETIGGMWQSVGQYQDDGSMKTLLHHTMVPAPVPGP